MIALVVTKLKLFFADAKLRIMSYDIYKKNNNKTPMQLTRLLRTTPISVILHSLHVLKKDKWCHLHCY